MVEGGERKELERRNYTFVSVMLMDRSSRQNRQEKLISTSMY